MFFRKKDSTAITVNNIYWSISSFLDENAENLKHNQKKKNRTVMIRMEQRQNGVRFFFGIILGVISSAWIKSIFETVEARIANNTVLDLMWSMWAIFFNICLMVYMTIMLVTFYKSPLWQLVLWNVGLAIPIFFTIPWSLLF